MNIDVIKNLLLETDDLFFNEKLRNSVKEKGEADFVTGADIRISEFMHDRLQNAFPDINFMSEESEHTLDVNTSCWILDPIDGTTNFIRGINFCSVSIALWSGNEAKLGVIYNPYTKEMFWAEKGKGAYLNENRIYCTDKRKLNECIGVYEYNAYYKDEVNQAIEYAKKIYLNCLDIRNFGSAALDMAYVACGRADVFLGRYLKPWDYVAGTLIVSEAGGKVSKLDGDIDITDFKSNIIACTSAVRDEFARVLLGE